MKKCHLCKVCGLFINNEPWGKDGKTPTYEICPCCGVEFGNEDCSEDSILEYRRNWIIKGALWFDEHLRPQDWEFKAQLEQLLSEEI